jgi:hypothetical protein
MKKAVKFVLMNLNVLVFLPGYLALIWVMATTPREGKTLHGHRQHRQVAVQPESKPSVAKSVTRYPQRLATNK